MKCSKKLEILLKLEKEANVLWCRFHPKNTSSFQKWKWNFDWMNECRIFFPHHLLVSTWTFSALYLPLFPNVYFRIFVANRYTAPAEMCTKFINIFLSLFYRLFRLCWRKKQRKKRVVYFFACAILRFRCYRKTLSRLKYIFNSRTLKSRTKNGKRPPDWLYLHRFQCDVDATSTIRSWRQKTVWSF